MQTTSKPSKRKLLSTELLSTAPQQTIRDIITEAELLKRIPVCRRTLFTWRENGHIPFIRVPGAKKPLYHLESVMSALLRMQRGGTQ